MPSKIQKQFAEGVVKRYRSDSSSVVKSSLASGSSLGHPEFAHLPIGASSECDLAIAFFDMSRFTARSFWEPLKQVTRLAQAVLMQLVLLVEESGGYALGLRGDGLMAGWGGSESSASVDTAMCLGACAVALDTCRGVLNDLLTEDGIEPVQLRAGVDWGKVSFIRTGTASQSDINIVGHPANFAAKCEKYANSWEVVVGEGASQHVDNKALLISHDDSPKEYQYKGERRYYGFSQFSWTQVVTEATSAIDQVDGQPTSLIAATY